MRIVYLGPFRLPNFDAAAARVLNVARAMRLAGHEISFISWGGCQRDEDRNNNGEYCIDGFPYVVTNEIDIKGSLFTKTLGRFKKGKKTKALLRSRVGYIDAIITYGGGLSQWLLRFCRKNNIYLVGDFTEWYAYGEMRLIERPLYFYETHYVFPQIKNKILISSYLDSYYHKSHNTIVPATCDSSEVKWKSVKKQAISKLGSFDGVTLIYAGTPNKKDALHYVIGVVNRLINEGAKLRFIILGCEENSYLNNCGITFKEKLSENIQFLGRVSQDDVPSYYALADFMVLIREQTRKSNAGFPTKFSESFTSGTPVIANLTSDIGQYLIDGESGFVVSEPNEESLYVVLKDKVLPLGRDEILTIKDNVKKIAKELDYHAYKNQLKAFLACLQ